MTVPIANGEQALELLRDLTLHPVEITSDFGTVSIPQGTFDTQERMLIAGRTGPNVYYLQGSTLFEANYAAFARGYLLTLITQGILDRTRCIVPATQIMLAFTMSFAIGALGALGTVASVTVVAAKIIVFRQNHQREVDLAVQEIQTIIRVMRWLHAHCPVTYAQMGQAIGPATWSVLASAAQGASAADYAAIVGRFFGGLWGSAGSLAFLAWLRIIGSVLTTAAIRVPGSVARADGTALRAAADNFIGSLQQSSVVTSAADAERIRREFEQNPEIVRQLTDLQHAVEQVTPVVQALSDAFRIDAMPEIQATGSQPDLASG